MKFGLAAAAAIGLVMTTGAALAQTSTHCSLFDGKTLNLIVGAAAGGGVDTYARAFAPVLEKLVGGQVVISYAEAGGGRAALPAVLAADPDGLTFGLFSGGFAALDEVGKPEANPNYGKFAWLGSIYLDSRAWIGRPDLDLAAPSSTPLLSATVQGAVAAVGMYALGKQMKLVPGYVGSSDFAAGVVRGEIDFYTISIETARNATKSGDIKMLVTLTDAPLEDFPDVPHLGGADGLAARLSNGDPKMIALAHSVTLLSAQPRSFAVSAAVPAAERDCLAALVWEAMQTPQLHADLEAAGRSIDPIDAAATTRLVDEMYAEQNKVRDLERELLEQAM